MSITRLILGLALALLGGCKPTGEMPARMVEEDFHIRQGRALYSRHCAACHGTTGKGDGLDWPSELPGKPADLTGKPLPTKAPKAGFGCPNNGGHLTRSEQTAISTFIQSDLFQGH